MYKYKAGDYVRIINNDGFDHHSSIKWGTIHRIDSISITRASQSRESEVYIILETKYDSGRLVVVKESQIEPCEAPSVEDSIRDGMKFRKGDIVRVIKAMPNTAIVGIILELIKLVRVAKIEGKDVNVLIGICGNGLRWEVYEDCLELVERGRKYKKGDKIQILNDSTKHGLPIGSIQKISSDYSCPITDGKTHDFLYEIGSANVKGSDFVLVYDETPYEVSMKEFEELRDKAIASNEPIFTSCQVKKTHIEEREQKRRRLLC